MTERGKINPYYKAIELSYKHGITAATDVAAELLNEVSFLGSESDDGQNKAFERVTYWSSVIDELNKLEY